MTILRLLKNDEKKTIYRMKLVAGQSNRANATYLRRVPQIINNQI